MLYGCVVDLHAITVEQDPAVLRENIQVAYAQVIAAGVDPDRASVFVQSHVPEHAQARLGYAVPHRFRRGWSDDAVQGQGREGAGREPRKRAVHLPHPAGGRHPAVPGRGCPGGRGSASTPGVDPDLGERFNRRYGKTFVIPKAHIVADAAKVLDLADPTAKMSKSSPAGCVFLLDPPKTITKKIKSAVTDNEATIRFDPEHQPGVSNLLGILAVLTGRDMDDIVAGYDGVLYGTLKSDVAGLSWRSPSRSPPAPMSF